jgi:hypothetical protein
MGDVINPWKEKSAGPEGKIFLIYGWTQYKNSAQVKRCET